MNATRTTLRQALPRWQRGIVRAVLLMGALAGMALVSAAHAQIAFRSSSSAFIAGGGGTPVAPTLRSASSAILMPGPTRLYALDTNIPYDPPTIRGTWPDGGTTTYRGLALSRAKFRSGSFKGMVRTGTSATGYVMIVKMVSDPLPTAQTISGTLDWVVAVGESSNSQNAFTRIHAYVLREPDTLVGTLLINSTTSYTEASASGNEWANPALPKGPAGGVKPTLTQVAAQAGDRIVIEFGWVGYSNRANDSGNFLLGGGTSDMALGGASNQAPWFEFSQDLFGSRINKPAGTVAGDVMIASIAVRPHTATITPPAGWNPVLPRVDNSAGTESLAIYRRTADASDSSVTGYVWSTSGATAALGTIQSFSGVDTANPIDVGNGQATPSATTHATPNVTTTVANTLLVAAHAMASGSVYWTPDATMTETVDVSGGSTTGGITLEGSTAVQATAGATGAKTATNGAATSYPGTTHILALRGVGGGGSTTLTITKPAGVAQNDVMIASIAVGPNTVTITPPAGWGLVRRTDNASGTSNSLAVYKLLAGASEPASYDWSFSAGQTGAAGGIMAFSGADPAIDVENGQNTASGTSHATPSVTTAFNNTMLITSHGVGAATTTWTPPSGMSEQVDANGGSAALEMNYLPQAASGSTGVRTATSSTSGTGNAHILALRRVFGSFNAFETSTGAGIGGVIKTKVAGTSISTAIVALNAPKNAVATYYIGTLKIEALDASNSSGVVDPNTGCNSTWTPITPAVVIPDLSFVPADNGRKNTSFTVPNSYPHVRLRMSAPSGAPDTIACSSDGFAIRPYQFTGVFFKDANPNNAGTTRTLDNLTVPGGIVHKAGRPFTVIATAVNGDGTTPTTNYTGTPTATVASCGASGNACVAPAAGATLTIGASFVAGQLSSDLATYNNVGAVAATLVDSSFAAVDSTDGSTPAEMNITSSPTNVGRFVPHQFAVAYTTPPTFGTACGGFTYVGQPFNYTVAPVITVTAQSFDGVTTTNYTGALWQITNASLTGKAYTAASGPVDVNGIPPVTLGTDPVIADTGLGTGTLTFHSPSFFAANKGFFLTRSTPVAPFNAEVSLEINVIDADGIAYVGNPARFGQASAGNGIAFSPSKEMRFGRLALRNANGSQLVPLPVQVEAQYWGYTNPPTNTVLGFITNKDDSCTSLANNNVQMSGFTANLAACQTAITGGGALSSGRIRLLLPPPGNANNGSVLLTANLSAAASGQACTAINSGTPIVPAAGADKSYLRGNWAGSATYADNPSARATFGTFKGSDEVIFIRENF